jgi:hypothetical protein
MARMFLTLGSSTPLPHRQVGHGSMLPNEGRVS